MLNIVAGLFVVFGLIGLFTLALRYLHNTGRLNGTPFSAKLHGTTIDPPIIVDSKRRIINITHRGQRYMLLLGPNNDILLESSSAVRIVEATEPDQGFDRQHV